MRLLVQPDDGIQLLLKAITHAKHSVEILIFRFDQREIERALANAVSRGVSVHALIAHTNRAGEDALRRLEMRLLGAGVTVARTADDLERYHGKLLLIDRRELYLLAFNWTSMDIAHSRSFGVVTRSSALVKEAERLFDADVKRHPYTPGPGNLVVSPANARKLLSGFLKGARKELIVYDSRIGDPAMIDLIQDRSRAGVEVKIIGHMARRMPGVAVRKPPGRLHTRSMVRDGNLAFIGSQSLRALELDGRREIGIIFRNPKAVARLAKTFAEDWALAEQVTEQKTKEDAPEAKVAKGIAKLVAKDLPKVAPVLDGAIKEIVGGRVDVQLDPKEVQAAVKGAVKDAVKEVVADMVLDVVDEHEEGRQ